MSDEVPYIDILMPFWGKHRAETPFTGSPSWTSTRDIKAEYFDTARRRGVYHHSIRGKQFRDLQTYNSGLAEGPGDDFVVTFVGNPDPEKVANTFMHEFGHNHGLGHGGDGTGNAQTTTVTDIDGDGFDDLWVEYRGAEVTRLSATASYVGMSGRMADGRLLLFRSPATRINPAPDGDEDGIHDACDLCPTVGAPHGPDGCPP